MTIGRSPIFKLLIAALVCASLITLYLQNSDFSTFNSYQLEKLKEYQRSIERLEALQQQIQIERQDYAQQLATQQAKIGELLAKATGEGPPVKPLNVDHYSYKVPDDLHKTHDIAIPRDIPRWTESDTDHLDTIAGFDMMADLLKLDYNKHEIVTDANKIDYARITRAERVYKSLWNHVYPIYHSLYLPTEENRNRDRDREQALLELAKTRPEIDFFLRLERRLFPWVHHNRKTTFSLFESYKGQGYVLCAGNPHFAFIVSAIQAIRSKIKSDLPIQVFHMGNDDLKTEYQSYIRQMTTNIEVIDITTVFDNEYIQLSGFAIKTYAILGSRFEEPMLIDADVYFLRDPAELYSDPAYQHTGTLFFYDRTLQSNWRGGPDWMRSMMPFMSTFPQTTRSFRGTTSYEQESGVVLINKKKRFLGLLATCKMNSKWERDLWSYKMFYGDKETFWFGFEMIQEPYAFVRNFGGVIGELRPGDDNAVCGTMLHQDYLGRPSWWNGGLMRNKYQSITRDLAVKYWMSGGGTQTHRERIVINSDMRKEMVYDLELNSEKELRQDEPLDPEWAFPEGCLSGWKVNELDQREIDLANAYQRIDKVVKADEALFQQGTNADPTAHEWATI